MTERTETLVVDGIRCMRCPPKIANALGAVAGVTGGSTTLTGDVTVSYTGGEQTRSRIVDALAAAGFPLRPVGDLG